MNIIVKIILIIFISFLLSLIPITPWFTPFIICFLIEFFTAKKTNTAFVSGFLSVFAFWLLYMVFYLSISNVGLPTKVAQIFSESTGHQISLPILITISVLLGGLLGGLSSLSGYLLSPKTPKQDKKFYTIKL